MNPDDPLGLLGAPAAQNTADPLGLTTSKPKIGQMGKAIVEVPEEASYGEKALGGIAALAHDIPGAEALQAGARSFFRAKPKGESHFGFQPTEREESYTEALDDIKGAEGSANKWVRRGNSIAGGTVAALAGPKGTFMNPLGKGGSAAVQAARFGAAQGALGADPMSNEDRILSAGKKGAVAGAVSGLVGDVPGKIAQLVRILGAKAPGAAAIARRGDINAADEAYPRLLEQAKGATHPDVTAMLEHPYIKPYATAARESPSLQGADDATIIHEVYKTLGTRQRMLADRTERAANYLAGPEREIQDIELVKKQLKAAADKIMPGYGETVATHAKLSGELEALKDTKDAAARIMGKSNVAGRNLETNSPEAFKINILKMKKEQAEAAREAMLGQMHEKAGDHLNGKVWKGFGLLNANSAIKRASPYLQMIEDQIKGGGAEVPLDELSASQSSSVLRKALSTSVGAHVAN